MIFLPVSLRRLPARMLPAPLNLTDVSSALFPPLVWGTRTSPNSHEKCRSKNQIFCLSGHKDTVGSLLTQGVDPQIISGLAACLHAPACQVSSPVTPVSPISVSSKGQPLFLFQRCPCWKGDVLVTHVGLSQHCMSCTHTTILHAWSEAAMLSKTDETLAR